MGIFNRGTPTKPNWWIMYTLPEQLRVQHGLTTRTVRESGGGGDQRAARSLLAQRKREVREGTWLPAELGTSGLLVETYAERWVAARRKRGVSAVRGEEQRLRDFVLPVIGKRPLREVTRKEVRTLMATIMSTPSKHTHKPHAPRTVHRIYEAMRTMFNDAVLDEIIVASPCTLRVQRGELPPKVDKDPRWRDQAVFTRDEVEQLISDPRIPIHRRVFYALALLGGMRVGEVSGRLWRDYDDRTEPLGKLLCATQYDDDPLKGNRPARQIPVHPTLATLLAEWKLAWHATYGRHPTPADFIVARRTYGRGTPAGIRDGAIPEQTAWQNLQRDLDKLGLRRRRLHDTRRTLISLALGDGASVDAIRLITHGRDKSIMGMYTTYPWPALCAAISCLRVELRTGKVLKMKRRKSSEDGE